MSVETEDVLPQTVAGKDPRISAGNRLRRLVLEVGPDCYKVAEGFAVQLQDRLKKYPAEATALSDALVLRAVDEIVRLRGTAEPKTYLPILAEALANETGQPRDLTTWAVYTWHDVLDV